MKKTILFLTLVLLTTNGCTKTWSGIKQDTRNAVENTKGVIHEATAPDSIIPDVPQADPKIKPLPNINPVDTLETVQNTETLKVPTSTVVKKTEVVEPVIL